MSFLSIHSELSKDLSSLCMLNRLIDAVLREVSQSPQRRNLGAFALPVPEGERGQEHCWEGDCHYGQFLIWFYRISTLEDSNSAEIIGN